MYIPKTWKVATPIGPEKRDYRNVGSDEKSQLPVSRRVEMSKVTNWYDLLRNLAPL
jgi:hypothetical protein